MLSQLLTPPKHPLSKPQLDENIMPITLDNELSSRLESNIKIIQKINHSRFERSLSRKKQMMNELDEVQNSTEKRMIMDQIIFKLDTALNQSKSTSRICRSQTKQLQEKIKAFENVLKEVKEVNRDSHDRIEEIKNIKGGYVKNYIQQERQNLPYHKRNYSVFKSQMPFYESHTKFRPLNLQTQKEKSVRFVPPKYIKPERPKNQKVCIEMQCRNICQCP